MEFLSNKPLLITDTILRDAHQSQAATRMTTADMLPALEMLDSIGYYSLECWGGATFDACMRFLNEDPWERLRTIRQHVKHTKLQMLFRGQNILGYKHYADDVVDAFCRKSIENGIDIIRIFDALNDVRNLEQAIKSTRKYGGEVEATMSYTVSPIHKEDYFVKLAKTLEDRRVDLFINNAGFGDCGPFLQTELDKDLDMLSVNIRAVHILTKKIGQKLYKQGFGSLLNVGSCAGLMPAGPYMATY